MNDLSHASSKKTPGTQQTPKEPIIVVDHVDMVFNIANEQLNSLKEYFIALVRGKLFFREFKALEDVSFTVNRGDVYGIVGTNGSGKSTMLKVIAGVLEPTRGSCSISGSIAPLIELGAGFDPELTARENVYLNGALLGYSKKFIDENFDSIVEFAEVENFIDMPLKNYSSGMVARIAFAIATATIPDILVVDEALSVGDFIFQEKCERRINDLVKNHGTTLLFVSHSIDQVERVCKQALWIERGHKRMEGSVEDVCFAYRNMEFTDFVEDHGIMTLKQASADELKEAVRIEDVVNALWRCAGRPDAKTADGEEPAMAWARRVGIILSQTAEPNDRFATRQDLADLIRRFSAWRKPSVSEYDPVDESAFSDRLPSNQEQRSNVEWCISHKLLAGMKSDDGALSLSLDAPASRVMLARMITNLYKKAYSYPFDVNPTDWYVLPGYYDYVTEHGIMGGYDNGAFGPLDPVTRAQAITALWRCAGKPEINQAVGFDDVKEGDYFYRPVAWALSCGVVTPDGTGLFHPDQTLDRQETATAVYRYVSCVQGAEPTDRSPELETCDDAESVKPENHDAFSWCIARGLMAVFEEEGRTLAYPDRFMSRSGLVWSLAIAERDILMKR